MTLSTAGRDGAEMRRARVAYWRVRGLSEREVAAQLAAEQVLNPKTGQPWSAPTVHNDCLVLTERWRVEGLGDTEALKARHWSELREVARTAWRDGDLLNVLRALKQEADLLGLNAPSKIDLEGYVRLLAGREGVDPDEAVDEAVRILRESHA